MLSAAPGAEAAVTISIITTVILITRPSPNPPHCPFPLSPAVPCSGLLLWEETGLGKDSLSPPADSRSAVILLRA